jgi:large subunit ribosomal protein L1
MEFRAEKTGIIHVKVGKISMTAEQIAENARLIFHELMRRKPNDIKGEYIKSIYLAPTMGPGIKIDPLTIK